MIDDIRSPAALADPYGFFAALRGRDPVHWSGASGAWIATSHRTVCEGFKEERLSSDRLGPLESRLSPDRRREMAQTYALLRGWMVFRDPPEHQRLREPVRRVFTPRAVERLAPRIEGIVAELLDSLAGRGRFELIEALAFPLPAIVIAELLGVPSEDRERFKHWSQQLSGLVFGAVERGGRDRSASLAAAEFTDYFEGLIRERESAPRDDLISAMVSAVDGLSRQELVGACTMLLFGGHETTTGLIANGVARLLEHPAEVERLRADPSLARSAVEEFLRFDGPATAMVRYVAQPFEWQGHRLEAGQRVYLAIAGANRDPAVFRDPDRFDVGRDPNPHLGFGHGRHFCLGAALARLEARIALEALLERFPRLGIAANDLRWGSSVIGRRVATLPLKVD